MTNPGVARREFLKTTAAGAGTALVGALPSSRALGANDRIRVGFIGVGLIGKRHLLDFQAQPDVEVAAVCEVCEPRLEEAIDVAGGRAARYKDFRKLLESKDVDAVVVSTPDHWHALMTIMACASGKDVYVEKPLTHAVCEGRWMIRAAEHHRRVVQVGTQQRSGEHYRRCVDLIRGGHLGEVRSVRIAAHRNIMPGFSEPVAAPPPSADDWSMWLGPAPFVPYDPRRHPYHFRWFWDYSGGQTTNLLSHNLDIVHWAMGSAPRAVSAMGARYALGGIGETPDVFEALFDYPGFLVNWSCRELCAGRDPRRGRFEFCGTKGVLAVDRRGFELIADPDIPPDDQIPRFTAPRPTRPDASKVRTEPMQADGYEEVRDQFRPHVRDFLDCVRSRRRPVSDLEGGHRTATACHLANISMKVGRTLRWDAEAERIVGDPEASERLTKEYRAPWDRELKAALPGPA